MYVDTYSLLDFLNWPTIVGSTITTADGAQLAIPRIASNLVLMLDLYINIFYTIFDIKSHYWTIFNYFELISLDIFIWIISYSYPALINEFNSNIITSLEDDFYQPTSWLISLFNTYLIIIFLFFSIIYMHTYGLRNSKSLHGITEGGAFLYAYLDEVEEECGQVEDVLSYLAYFAVFVLWFYFFNLFAAAVIINYINWILTLFCFILILGVVVPSSLLSQIGIAFVQYVRGAGRGTSLLFETLLDFVSVSVIMIRFFVQNVRFVFIFVGFFEYYEYIDSKVYPLHDLVLPHITWSAYWRGDYKHWYWFELFLQIFVQIVTYLYYVGHLTITYIAQLSIYIILSFWIYFFLYTTFSLPSKEKYFFYKRHIMNK